MPNTIPTHITTYLEGKGKRIARALIAAKHLKDEDSITAMRAGLRTVLDIIEDLTPSKGMEAVSETHYKLYTIYRGDDWTNAELAEFGIYSA